MTFSEMKKWAMDHLKKQMKDEPKESETFKKSIDMLFNMIQKSRGLPVGTIREWKGNKYKKMPNNHWVRVYDKSSRGANHAIAAVLRKIETCQDETELYNIIQANIGRFSDANGIPLPEVEKIHKASDEKKGKFSSGEGKKESPKGDSNKEAPKSTVTDSQTAEKVISDYMGDKKDVGDRVREGNKEIIFGNDYTKKHKLEFVVHMSGVFLGKPKMDQALFDELSQYNQSANTNELEKKYGIRGEEALGLIAKVNEGRVNIVGDNSNKEAETEKYDDDKAYEEYQKLLMKENPTAKDNSRIGELVTEHYKHSKKEWIGGKGLQEIKAAKNDSDVLSNGKTVKEVREKYGIKSNIESKQSGKEENTTIKTPSSEKQQNRSDAMKGNQNAYKGLNLSEETKKDIEEFRPLFDKIQKMISDSKYSAWQVRSGKQLLEKVNSELESLEDEAKESKTDKSSEIKKTKELIEDIKKYEESPLTDILAGFSLVDSYEEIAKKTDNKRYYEIAENELKDAQKNIDNYEKSKSESKQSGKDKMNDLLELQKQKIQNLESIKKMYDDLNMQKQKVAEAQAKNNLEDASKWQKEVEKTTKDIDKAEVERAKIQQKGEQIVKDMDAEKEENNDKMNNPKSLEGIEFVNKNKMQALANYLANHDNINMASAVVRLKDAYDKLGEEKFLSRFPKEIVEKYRKESGNTTETKQDSDKPVHNKVSKKGNYYTFDGFPGGIDRSFTQEKNVSDSVKNNIKESVKRFVDYVDNDIPENHKKVAKEMINNADKFKKMKREDFESETGVPLDELKQVLDAKRYIEFADKIRDFSLDGKMISKQAEQTFDRIVYPANLARELEDNILPDQIQEIIDSKAKKTVKKSFAEQVEEIRKSMIV